MLHFSTISLQIYDKKLKSANYYYFCSRKRFNFVLEDCSVMAVFTINVECNDRDFWRFNYVVMCSVRRDGEEVEFLKHRDEVAPVGAELRELPAGYNPERGVTLKSVDADELTLYIYVIPHTLPRENSTRDIAPLNMSLIVDHGIKTILKRHVEINPWSGENLELRLNSAADC